MKTFLNLLACLVIFAVAAFVGNAFGFFKVPALDNARNYGTSLVSWAKNGFKGSPTAAVLAATSAQPEAAAPSQPQAELAHLINESKKRAVAKYPDLGIANTEMNSRFVFRYNWLAKENNERLQDPNWPETLADECAAAAKVHVKPSTDRSLAGTNSKRLVASSAQ